MGRTGDRGAAPHRAQAAPVHLGARAADGSPLSSPSPERGIRLLFLNAYLLRPRLWSGGPALPPIQGLVAPAVPERARELAEALPGSFDVVALCEVFEPTERETLLRGWGGRDATVAVGPDRSFPPSGPLAMQSSGLLTIVDSLPVTRIERHRFDERGSRLVDGDAWANKGMLLVEVDPGLGAAGGRIEIFSTHLLAGGELVPGVRRAREKAQEMRRSQLAELLEFVRSAHHPGNVAVLCGDFNIPAERSDGDGPVPSAPGATSWYRDLCHLVGTMGFDDLWAADGVGRGETWLEERNDGGRQDPDAPGCLVDDPAAVAVPGEERVDYLFLQRPDPTHKLRVAAARPRRMPFVRPSGAVLAERMPRGSDHLGLAVELCVTPAR